MSSAISALLAFIATLFRSCESLRLEHLALRHKLAVYQQMVHRPRLRPSDEEALSGALETLEPARHARPSPSRQRSAQSDPRDVPSQPDVGFTTDGWRAAESGIEVAKSTVEKYRLRPRKPSSPTWLI
jgi:hypothetical protein